MPLSVILLALVMLGLSPAHAGDPEPGQLCLSDGQPLEGVLLDVRGAHRTVRIDQHEVRIPDHALGSTCRMPAQSTWTEGVRLVILEDGQTLVGTPLTGSSGVSLVLLDGQKLLLPRGLVRHTRRAVTRTEEVPAETTPARPEPQRAPARSASAPVATLPVGVLSGPFGLGIIIIALLGGILFGLHRVQEAHAR